VQRFNPVGIQTGSHTYVASGAQYGEEALRSASSLKEIMPDIETAIFVPDIYLE